MSIERPLQGKKVAVLVESLYIPDEIKAYMEDFPRLGATWIWCHAYGANPR